MVQTLRWLVVRNRRGRHRVANHLVATLVLCLGTVHVAFAQAPGVHYRHRGDMSPGAIGRWQLQRGGPLPGYFQPVEITAPPGAMISLAEGGAFSPPEPAPIRAGFLIAPVYRLRVTNIPLAAGAEVYPTIEVIDRTYPPPELTMNFPILIEITQEDLELALDGKFVTRVIYLEDPHQALPHTYEKGHQAWFDAGPGTDPLYLADLMGRPVAILRMGGRIPLEGELGLGECAPFIRIRPKPPHSELFITPEFADSQAAPSDRQSAQAEMPRATGPTVTSKVTR